MRILELTENTKSDLLESLLKRSPNSYGEYEGRVNAIIDEVREKGMKRFLHSRRSSTELASMRIISL